MHRIMDMNTVKISDFQLKPFAVIVPVPHIRLNFKPVDFICLGVAITYVLVCKILNLPPSDYTYL